MPLSWNEIRARSITFSREWSDASRERSEAQTFWNEFFEVFGKSRRAVASFEEPVKNLKGATDFIDLIWPGHVIAEHKSRGKDLSKAQTQAIGYVHSLISDGREDEVPRYILVSDFARLAIHDLESDDPTQATIEFALSSLHEHIRRFAFLAGYETQELDPEDPANLKAASLLANLHDRLEDGGYTGHDLQRFMVRILFCLFAEDTGIFEPDAFKRFIENRTDEDGSDLGPQLARLFDVLNTPEDRRQKNLDEDLAELPYVNGRLYEEHLAFADFDSAMRRALLTCCGFKWQNISPAVFGSLFQSIMEPRDRRQIGAHYTSERDILKLIRSLFLDQLRGRLDKIKSNRKELNKFIKHLGTLKFLDPACGCGNFLVLGYRELRRLEMDALQARFGEHPNEGELRSSARLSVDQFYGIEIEEWPALIAEVGMWLMDHQMNNELFARFGSATATVPLKKSPHITCANALRIDWNDVLPADECSYIMGNPPFVGKKEQTAEQKAEVREVWRNARGAGILDYVTCWYAITASYMNSASCKAAFVSTNSITQGEQVGAFWKALQGIKEISLNFAHSTFAWISEAKGRAHVHVVIIGFGIEDQTQKMLFIYDGPDGKATATAVSNISPYLSDGPNLVVETRARPLCDVPPMAYGSMMIDKDRRHGPEEGLILDFEWKERIIAEAPALEPYIKSLYGGDEFLNGEKRWCLWLIDAEPSLIRSSPELLRRLDVIRRFRLSSSRERTRELARTPHLFGEIRQPSSRYLFIPKVSSERRLYIPIGFVEPEIIATGSALVVANATLFTFGILCSAMHNTWMRRICGRMKSDYQYSARLVYNNYPWPESMTEAKRLKVEGAAQGVLDARLAHPGSTLADLYDPLTMPADLAKAHGALDRAVDRCYRAQPFPDERRRFEYLFEMYEKLVTPLTAVGKKKRGRGG